MNFTAPNKASTVAMITTRGGRVGIICHAKSMTAIAANAAAQTAVMTTLTRTNSASRHNAGGTLSRAYCTVNGWPIAIETSTTSNRPASMASRTPAMDQAAPVTPP